MIKQAPIPAVAYVRMSDDSQETSPDQQREELAKLAVRENCKIIREYFDSGISGDRTEKRQDFLNMRAAAASGDFRAVLCWDQDRFGRFDLIDAGHWIKPFRDSGVRLCTVAQGWIDWEDLLGQGQYMMGQIGKAQFLRDLSRNALRGLKRKAERGELLQPCYGLAVVDGTYVVIEPEAKVIRRIARTYRAPGGSLRGLCELLNSEGVPSPTGKRWVPELIRQILTRRKYTGAYVWGVTQVGKYHCMIDGELSRRPRGRIESEPIVIEGRHEPIMSVAEFDEVGQKLEQQRRRTSPVRGGGDYLLSGVIKCGNCGSPMYGQRGNGKKGYCCGGYMFKGSSTCSRNTIREEPLVRFLIGAIQREFLAPERLEKLKVEIERQAKADPSEGLAKLRGSLRALEAKIDQGADRIMAAPATIVDTLYAKLEKLHQDRDKLLTQIEAEETAQAARKAPAPADVGECIQAMVSLQERLLGAPEEDLRELLQSAVSEVRLWFETYPAGKRRWSRFVRGEAKLWCDLGVVSLSTSISAM